MGCGVGSRRSLDLVLLWCRPVATAPNGPLAWEPPYTKGVALKITKDKKKKLFCTFNNSYKENKCLHHSKYPYQDDNLKIFEVWSSRRGTVVNESD